MFSKITKTGISICTQDTIHLVQNIFDKFITFITEMRKYCLNYCMPQTLYRFMATKQDCEQAQGTVIYESL